MTVIRELDAGEFSHQALLYRDEWSYLAGTLPFVEDGLAAGEPVAVAVPGLNLKRIESALGESAADVRLIDMSRAGRNPGRIIAGVLRAFADSHEGRVRIIGEPIWPGRTEDEYPACVQHEALINAAFAGRPVTILCPYDVAGLDGTAVADAEATHPILLDEAGYHSSGAYAPDDVIARYNQPLQAPVTATVMSFDLGSLSKVRHFAVDCAVEYGVTADRLDDLALAVGELTGNSVLHGGGSGVLRLWRAPRAVVCEVSDTGCVTDPLAGRRPATPGQQGGRGLLLVHHVVDLVRAYLTPTGTTTRVYFGVSDGS